MNVEILLMMVLEDSFFSPSCLCSYISMPRTRMVQS